MKQGISLPQIPKKLLDTNKELYDYLFGLQQALLAKQTDDYSAVDKTSTDLTTLSGSVTSFITDNKASQAEAIAGTLDTKIITPHTLREGFNASGSAPVYACRAWVNFNGTGTVAIRASGNVSSVTDNGTGLYTLNFVNALPDANYAVSVMSTLYASNNGTVFPYINGTQTGGATVKTTTALQIIIATTAGRGYDMAEINVSIFR